MLGNIGTLWLTGTGGTAVHRFINPRAIRNNVVDWPVYFNHVERVAAQFGSPHRFFWCPGGVDGSSFLALDQWRLLYPSVFDRHKADASFSTRIARQDTIYVGSRFTSLARSFNTNTIEQCLNPFLDAGAIGFDASSFMNEHSDFFVHVAVPLSENGIRPLAESMIHRDTAWNQPLMGCVMNFEIYKKYNRPVKEWPSHYDQKVLLPFDEYQCPISLMVAGDLDNAAVSPTPGEVAQALASGHNVYVAPSSIDGLWRGHTAASLIHMASAI